MMSYPVNEGVRPYPTQYQTIVTGTPSAVPVPNVHIASSVQNINPSPPVYYVPPSNQAWSVPHVVPQWNLSTIIPPNEDQSLAFFQTFLKGKPKPLGILVICASILEIALGIGLTFTSYTITTPSGISFWGPVFCIIAGSLTIGAQAKPNDCLIRGSLSLNIISCIFSAVALILNAVDLGTIYLYGPSYYYNYNTNYAYAQELHRQKLVQAYIVLALLLVINLLLFCVTISTSIFGCRSLSKIPKVVQVFVIQNDAALAMNLCTVPIMWAPPQAGAYTPAEVQYHLPT
ncbi:membrane-spanning 4-domains subfamily A member 4A-like [Mantella aurantiaca]